jgi:hypothetical protein
MRDDASDNKAVPVGSLIGRRRRAVIDISALVPSHPGIRRQPTLTSPGKRKSTGSNEFRVDADRSVGAMLGMIREQIIRALQADRQN